jgi:hypothetical protein
MKVTVNDRQVSTCAAEQSTLRGLLDELRGSGQIPADQVIVGLTVGGRAWRGQDFEDGLGTPLEHLGAVAIDTTDLHGYGRRILSDADAMLSVICEAASRISDQFRCGSPQEASSHLYNLFESLQRFLFCLCQVRSICLPDAPDFLLHTPASARLNAALDEMQACQEVEEWQTLADRIDTNLLPALQGFHGVVGALGDAF